MEKQILRVSFEPRIEDMGKILPQAGFRPLVDATPEDLPAGSVVVVYNRLSNSMYTIVIFEHYRDDCFSYMNFNRIDEYEAECSFSYNRRADFSDSLYKVIFHLPVVASKPKVELLPHIIKESGFKSLDEASTEDLPDGCVAMLYYVKNGNLFPLVVRTLSLENRRLLYLRERIVAGNWESKVLMNHLNPFTDYLYKVIS